MAKFNALLIITSIEMEGNGFKSFFEANKLSYQVSVVLPLPLTNDEVNKITEHTLVILDTDSFENKKLVSFLCNLAEHEIKCIVYSRSSGPGLLIKTRQIGISGYVSKASSLQKLLDCINVLELDGLYYDSCFSKTLKEIVALETKLSLTERNILYEVLLFPDCTIREISQSLNISKHTTEVHLSNLYQKLGIHSFPELVKRFSV